MGSQHDETDLARAFREDVWPGRRPPGETRRRFVIGVDLGTMRDHSAIAIVEPQERPDGGEPFLDVPYLERMHLGTKYRETVERVRSLTQRHPIAGAYSLVIDVGGVGRGVLEEFQRVGLKPVPVTITGGGATTHTETGEWHVPKRDLAIGLDVSMQNRLLRIAKELAHAELIPKEAEAFRAKISAAGHDSYEAATESAHDDLVIAVALAVWRARRSRPPRPLPPVKMPSRAV